jgi:hypothetical protein
MIVLLPLFIINHIQDFMGLLNMKERQEFVCSGIPTVFSEAGRT